MQENTKTIAKLKVLETNDNTLIELAETLHHAVKTVHRLKTLMRKKEYRSSGELENCLTATLNNIFKTWILFRHEVNSGQITRCEYLNADFAENELLPAA